MNKIEELKYNVEALSHAVKEDKKFFAGIFNFVEKLTKLVSTNRGDASQQELYFLAKKIEEFFSKYRSSSGLYIPPSQTSRVDSTVRDIHKLTSELSGLSEEEFESLKLSSRKKTAPTKGNKKEPCVFIGHGRSKLWAALQIFLQNELDLKTVYYESESRVGDSIVPILKKMLEEASYAVLVLTAEDQTENGGVRARQNVIHEAGLFQGKLGFDRAVLLVQRGVEGFTNVDGLQYIPFTDDNIEEAFYPLQKALKTKGLISS